MWCPNGCGMIDSLDHLLECYKMGTPDPDWPFEDRVNFLCQITTRTAKNCPALPSPVPMITKSVQICGTEPEEISLADTKSLADGFSNGWELEIDEG